MVNSPPGLFYENERSIMKIKKYQYEKNNIIVLSLTMLANLLNYIFQITMGNMMSVADYGMLNALLSFYVILSMITNLFQTFTARNMAMYQAGGETGKAKYYFIRMLKLGGLTAVLMVLTGKVISPWIAGMLKISQPQYIGYTFLAAAAGVFAMVCWGALQGLEKFISFSLSNDCASVVKLVMAVVFIQAGFGVAGVWVAMILSILSITVWGSISLYSYYRVPSVPVGSKMANTGKGFVLETIIIQILLALLTNCDVLLVKAFLPDEEIAGVYAAAITLGKIPLFIATTIAAVLLPTVVNAYIKRENTKIYLYKAMGYSAAITITYTIVLQILAQPVITLLYGERYLAAVELLIPVGIFIFIIIMLTVMMNYFIACAQTRRFSLSVTAGVVLSALGVFARHNRVSDILYVISAVMMIVVLINLFTLNRESKSEQSE